MSLNCIVNKGCEIIYKICLKASSSWFLRPKSANSGLRQPAHMEQLLVWHKESLISGFICNDSSPGRLEKGSIGTDTSREPGCKLVGKGIEEG